MRSGTIATKWVDEIDDVMGDNSPRNLYSKQLCLDYLREKSLLLDIGCGNGTFLHSLNREMTLGIELEDSALRIARKHCPKSEFIQASSLNLPFRDGIFDHITLWEVIEHIPKGTEEMLISEISRVLKSNASLAMSTPNNHYASIMLDPAYFLKGHRHYSLQSLAQFLLLHGFSLQKQTIKGGLGMLIATNLFYFFKHVLKRRPSGMLYELAVKRSMREFSENYRGMANCFLVARKVA